MTALHDRARKLAEKLTEGEWDGPSPDEIADAMVSLARDFAREAIRQDMVNRQGLGGHLDETIEAAIAAAEKGSTDDRV